MNLLHKDLYYQSRFRIFMMLPPIDQVPEKIGSNDCGMESFIMFFFHVFGNLIQKEYSLRSYSIFDKKTDSPCVMSF